MIEIIFLYCSTNIKSKVAWVDFFYIVQFCLFIAFKKLELSCLDSLGMPSCYLQKPIFPFFFFFFALLCVF